MPSPTRPRPRRDRRHDPSERLRRAREAQEAAYEAAKVVLERATARRDAEWRGAVAGNRRRARIVLGVPVSLGVAVLLVGLALHPALIVGAALLALWAVVAGAAWENSRSLPGRFGGSAPAEAVARGELGPAAAERLADLCEGLCASLGLPLPTLRVLKASAPNAISLGRRPEGAVLVVTSGLLELLDRIELEAVVAHELAHLKRHDVLTAALASSPLGRSLRALGGERALRWLIGPDREIRADLAAVATTRYPPGLISALERMGGCGDTRPATIPPRLLERTASCWLAPVVPAAGEAAIDDRLDVLREL